MFEYALTIGMSADEYWEGDPHLLFRYENAYLNRRKIEEQGYWLQGVYIRCALQSSCLNVNGFIEKPSQILDYPECPHKDMAESKRELTPEERALLQKARALFSARGVLRNT